MSPPPDTPAYRYNAALANRIEAKWQDRWDADHTFWAPNPSGPLADGFDAMADRRKLFVLDMFPYPSGAGLHVGHPLGYIGTDVFARFMRMRGHNVLHAMGYDAFGLPAEQYAVQTGQHPRVTTEANVANMRRQLRALGLGHDPRRGIATTDVDYYRWTQWIFLQIYDSWYDDDAGPRPADRRAARGARRRHARPGERRRSRGTPLARPRWRRASRVRRLLPPRLPRRGAGELVPGARHRPRQRGGHRRRPQRARQPPRVPSPARAVDAAHHRVLGPPARRSRSARLARVDQADAAQLDRPQRRRRGRVRGRGAHRRRDRRLHDSPRHAVRRHLHGARARASAGRPRSSRTSGPRIRRSSGGPPSASTSSPPKPWRRTASSRR